MTDIDGLLLAAMADAEADDASFTSVVVQEIPPCDFCGDPAEFDAQAARIPSQPWGYMCAPCFLIHGPGRLGAGYGQRLVLAGRSS